jgi:PAS domain S-box-containing protein
MNWYSPELTERIARSLGVALELRGLEPIGHTDRVVGLVERLAQELELNEEEVRDVRLGAFLHDLGKFGVPIHIATETGPLEPSEWAVMRRHASMGLEFAANVPGLPQGALELIASHHERWDGTGYPRGLEGTMIPLSARVFAVIDAFCAMTADWWNARAVGVPAAMYQLKLERGEGYEARIVDALASVLALDGLDFAANPRPRSSKPSVPFEAEDQAPTQNFVLLDVDLRLLYASPAAFSRFELDSSAERSGLEFVHPDDRVKVALNMREMLGSGRRAAKLEARIGRAGAWETFRFEPDHVANTDGSAGLIFVWFEELTNIELEVSQQVSRPMSLTAQAFARSNAAIVVTDSRECIVDASPAFIRQTGYELHEMLGRTPKFLQGPNSSREALGKLRRGIDSGLPCQAEVVNYRKDGTEFWSQINIDPVFGPDGKPSHFVSIQSDITDLKRAQAEEQRLLEVTHDAILVTDLDGRVVRANNAVESVFAQAFEALKKKKLEAFFAESDREEVKKLIASVIGSMGDAPLTLEARGRSERGWGRWISWSVTAFPEIDRLYWVGRDVTERKMAAMNLKRERDFITSVVDTAASLVMVLDRGGKIVQFNRSCERITGYGFSEVRNQALWELLEVGENQGRVRDFFEEGGGILPNEIELEMRSKSGEVRLISFSNTILSTTNGLPEFFVTTGIDITSQRAAETALRASEARHKELFLEAEAQRLEADKQRGEAESQKLEADNQRGEAELQRLEAERGKRKLELLGRVRSALEGELERDSSLRAVVEAVSSSFGYDLVSAYTIEPNQLRLAHAVGVAHAFTEIPLDMGIEARIITNAQGELLEDASSDPDFVSSADGVKSRVTVPLFEWGKVVGVLNVETLEGRTLSNDDLRALTAVAEHVGLALERSSFYTQIRDSEQQYRGVIERINDGIIETDPSGVIRFANPAWSALTARENLETVGKNILEFVHPDDALKLRPVLDATLKNTEAQSRFEVRLLTNDGRFKWVLGATHRAFDATGRFVAASTVLADINDLKALEIRRHLSARSDSGLYGSNELQRALEALVAFVGAADGFIQTANDAITVSTSMEAALEAISQSATSRTGMDVETWDGDQGAVFSLFDGHTDPDSSRVFAGRLGVRWETPHHTPELATLRAFLPEFGNSLARAQAHRDLLDAAETSQEFLEATLLAQESERERIALGLHDGPAQTMVSAMRFIESTMALPEAEEHSIQTHLERSVRLISDAVGQMRETINDLIPPDLEILGLQGTIQQRLEGIAREESWSIETHLEPLKLPKHVAVTLYRIFCEALTNVQRHARASKIIARLETRDDDVVLEILDNGAGFTPNPEQRPRERGGVGTMGMRKRAELIGCKFEIESTLGAGTCVRVRLPAQTARELVK